MGTRTRGWLVSVIALAVGIVVAIGLGSWQLSVKSQPAPVPVADEDQAREQVTQFVTANVGKMLSYTPTTSRSDIDEVAQLLTGAADDEYHKTIRTKPDGVTQSARIRNTGVESLTAGEAKVVAFIDKTSEAADGSETKDALAYRVTLTRLDGNWLISELEPL
ncbi:hypothetical protein FR943_03525 [Mycobacterium sp. TNTM28]|uniref:Mammalian cell entry protein n=1 Tax=[Mycobacterium] fortunisiensis TaxID=2600579 RepID=A0ABS6KH76_9MYCO|nr:hypothetical protein [[Mycobacterium] fortunisiensis]MBU9762924.1 hypothetical protein [[Mycobacterium] fortunisiensis]